jgi:hypothetical protein
MPAHSPGHYQAATGNGYGLLLPRQIGHEPVERAVGLVDSEEVFSQFKLAVAVYAH